MILAVVAGVIVATKASGTRIGTAATGQGGVVATTEAGAPASADAGASATASALPSGGAAGAANPSPAASSGGATDVFRSGTVRLASALGRPVEAFDLDSATKGDASRFGGGQRPDLVAAAHGLAADGDARFAVWTLPGSPTAAGCAAIPAALWSLDMVVEPLVIGPVLCVRTNEGRMAAITPRIAPAGAEGELYASLVDFVVWRKAG